MKASNHGLKSGDNVYIKKVEEKGVIRLENIHFVSCQTGFGIGGLVNKIMSLSKMNGKKVYVMGAANVGKSSFINRMLESNGSKGSVRPEQQQSLHKDKAPHATVSSLPGTTLNFLRMTLPDDVVMIDTPGLINNGQLTSRLTFDELKKVVPIKPVNAVTFRVEEGKCVMIGGLATVELTAGRPLYFTFFIANEIKLHPTSVARKEHLIENQLGDLISPPVSLERWKELGPFENIDFEVEGSSWKESSTDIVIAGLGWVSVTGPGKASIRVSVPAGTSVRMRPPLLPFEATYTTAKFSGGRIIKKSKKVGPNKVKQYGWRA
jgi:ribosome biogenesis GTPase A